MLGNVLESIDRRRFNILVISLTTRSPVGDRLAALGIPVVALGGHGGVLTLKQLTRLVRTARAWRPDIIHTWMYHSNLLGHALRCLSKGQRAILITSIRSAMHAREQEKLSLRMVRRFDAALSGRADRIVFNSAESARQHTEYGYEGRSIEIIPNGFDVLRFAPSAERRISTRCALGVGEEPLVGLIGRFDRSKGHRFFLTAAAEVHREFAGCRFVLAGRGCDSSNSQLLGWIEQCGLAERVMLLGERRDICDLDCALDVVVCSSISESFPNSIGEAMACATPVVVTDVGGCRELVGDAGIVVPPRNVGALAGGIMCLLRKMGAERTEIGKRARTRIIENYSLPVIAARFASLYESAVAQRQM